MRSPALLAIDADAGEFAPLFAAAAARGERLGWLDLTAADGPPPPLASPAEAGAAKAVAVAPHGALAWKRRSGAAVLRDLLREHFLGFRAVLVRGADAGPRLSPAPGGFRIASESGGMRELDAEALLDELRRPRYRR